MGTGVIGLGAAARHWSLNINVGTLTGRTTPVPSIALEIANTNVGLD